MLRSELDTLVTGALTDRRLLAHPFYRRWEAGTLLPGELAAYAGQYRHFEAALPGLLEGVGAALEDPDAAAVLARNLADERGDPAPHLALFDDFVASVGGRIDAAATPATAALVDGYRRLAATDAVAALAALSAYEVQAPEIAASKAAGLRARYGLGPDGTRFWDVHGELDAQHSAWMLDALAQVATTPAVVEGGVAWAADAWWSFLDEREAAAASYA